MMTKFHSRSLEEGKAFGHRPNGRLHVEKIRDAYIIPSYNSQTFADE